MFEKIDFPNSVTIFSFPVYLIFLEYEKARMEKEVIVDELVLT